MKKYIFIGFLSIIFSLFIGTSVVLACDPGCASADPAIECLKPQCSDCNWCIERANSSLDRYGQSLIDCADGNTTNLNCWIGNTEEVRSPSDDGSLGVTGGIASSLNYMINGSNLAGAGRGLAQNTGVVGGVTRLIVFTSLTPPLSSTEYLADIGTSLGIVKPAYAQGTGFTALRSILPIWKSFRDVAYVFFILVFIAIGFMIMFRIKIDPRTVITIQNSIPKIIIALILVTFSYAIAGLLIDLMYLVTSVGIALINPRGTVFQQIVEAIKGGVGVIADTGVLGGLGETIKSFLNQLVSRDNPNLFYFMMTYLSTGRDYATTISHLLYPATLIGEMLNLPSFVVDLLAKIPLLGTGIVGTLASLVLGVILLFALIKTLLSVVGAYVRIIIMVIIAPLFIMLEAIPGQKAFGNWFRNIVSNIAVFPAIILYLAMMTRIIEEVGGGMMWSPPILGTPGPNPPSRIIIAMIGYGMLLLLPKMVNMVQDALKVPAFKYGSAIGEAMKPVTKPISGAWGWTKGTIGKGTKEIGGDVIAGALTLNRASRRTPTGSPTIPIPTGSSGNATAEE